MLAVIVGPNLWGQDPQSADPSKLMYTAATINSELLWDRAIEVSKNAYDISGSGDDLIQLCYAYYGKMGNCISRQAKDEGEDIAELGLAAAEKLTEESSYKSEALALMAGYNGMAIALSPMKGMYLGPKSDSQVSKSLELEPENPIGWLQKGSSQYNTPRIFGGNARKSIESFKKSIQYFESDTGKPLWMKIEAMIWLGQAYYYEEDYESARETYNKILAIVPGHDWVVNILLPVTLEKLK